MHIFYAIWLSVSEYIFSSLYKAITEPTEVPELLVVPPLSHRASTGTMPPQLRL